MRLPNGFGSVHKLTGNRRKPYRVRITVGWKDANDINRTQKYKTIGYFATKEEGLIALACFNKNPYDISFDNMTFNEVYKLWSNEQYKNITSSSKRIWIAAYKHSECLYNKNFRSLKVADWELAINVADVGAATKLRMKCLYNMMYKYAIKHEITDKNYAMYCDVPRVVTVMERLPFSDEEIDILWDNLNMPFVDMILINIYSGLRPRELVELQTKNIDLEKRLIVGGMKTDAGKNRYVPIHDKIYFLIKKRFDLKNERLFLNEDMQEMDYYSYRLRFMKVMKNLNMFHRPHDARHTFITKAKHADINEYMLKQIVGHKISDITEKVYTHRNIDELYAEINKIK